MKRKERGEGRFLKIIPLLCLIFFCSPGYSQSNNAADYYRAAVEEMVYPTFVKSSFKIQQAIRSGWPKESSKDEEKLRKVLEKNKEALVKLKKGTLCKWCDFNLGKKFRYFLEKKFPPFLGLSNLSNLLLLQGRFYEKEGKYNEALDNYLSSLTFAYHISLGKDTPSKAVALHIERNTLPLLKGYLRRADKEGCLKIHNFIQDYMEKRFPIEEVVEGEKEFFISNLQIIVDRVKRSNRERDKVVEKFIKKLYQERDKLLREYYGLITEAVTSNKEEDWQKLEEKSRELREEIAFSDRSSLEKVIDEAVRETEEVLVPKLVKIILLVNSPNLRRITDRYYNNLKDLKEIGKRVSVRLTQE